MGCKMCERLRREYPEVGTHEEMVVKYFPNAITRETLAEKEIIEPDDTSIGEGDVITYIGL